MAKTLPGWAILPTAGKLVTSSIRHPTTGKAVYVNSKDHSVDVRSINGATTSHNRNGYITIDKDHSKA